MSPPPPPPRSGSTPLRLTFEADPEGSSTIQLIHQRSHRQLQEKWNFIQVQTK